MIASQLLTFVMLGLFCPPSAEVKTVSAETVVEPVNRNDAVADLRIEVIPLSNALASHLEATLTHVLSRKKQTDRPTIVADARSNSLIVHGPAHTIGAVRQLIRELDTPPTPAVDSPDVPSARTKLGVKVFEAKVPRRELASISVDSLTKRLARSESMETILADYGATKLLHQTDQIINLQRNGQRIAINAEHPFVRSSTTTSSGNQMSQIEFESIGLTMDVSGTLQTLTTGNAYVKIELKNLTESDIPIGNGVMAPVVQKCVQSFSGDFTSGTPIILLMIDGQGTGDAVVIVTCVQFDVESK